MIHDERLREETFMRNMIRLREMLETVRTTKWLRLDYLGGGLDGCAVLQQELHDLDAILLACDVQRSEAIQRTCVRVGFPV